MHKRSSKSTSVSSDPRNSFDVFDPCRFVPKTFKSESLWSNDAQTIQDLLHLLRDEQQGLSFVKDAALPEYSFIAIEAIWWSIEHGEDVRNEETAMHIFQVGKVE